MYAPVHHGNNPALYSNYMFKGKGRNRPFQAPGRFAVRGRGNRAFRAPGRRNVRGRGFITKDQAKEGLSKAMKVGVPLIGKLIKGISKQQRRQKRRSRRKLRKLKGGNEGLPLFGGPFGKLMAMTAGFIKSAEKKVAERKRNAARRKQFER